MKGRVSSSYFGSKHTGQDSEYYVAAERRPVQGMRDVPNGKLLRGMRSDGAVGGSVVQYVRSDTRDREVAEHALACGDTLNVSPASQLMGVSSRATRALKRTPIQEV